MQKAVSFFLVALLFATSVWCQVPTLPHAREGNKQVTPEKPQSWTSKRKRIWGKLQATIFVLACLGFLWFAFAGNLLRFSSNY